MRPISNLATERQFSLRESSLIAGVPEKWVRNYDTRKQLEIARDRHGRMEFSAVELVRLKTMHELAVAVKIGPSDARDVGDLLVKEILDHAPSDSLGRPVIDQASMPLGLAFGLAFKEGELHVGKIDASRPGYFQGDWAGPHIVVPVAAILNSIVFGILNLQSEAAA
jgi:hypothetical protein